LLNETSFLNKNAKLAPKFTGPHRILQFKSPVNVEILLAHSNRKLVVHVNRIKPYVLSHDQITVPLTQNVTTNESTFRDLPIQFQNKGGMQEMQNIDNGDIPQQVFHNIPPPVQRQTSRVPPPVQRQMSRQHATPPIVEKPLTRSATRAQNLVFNKQTMTYEPLPAPVIAYMRKKINKKFGYIYPSDELYTSLSESYCLDPADDQENADIPSDEDIASDEEIPTDDDIPQDDEVPTSEEDEAQVSEEEEATDEADNEDDFHSASEEEAEIPKGAEKPKGKPISAPSSPVRPVPPAPKAKRTKSVDREAIKETLKRGRFRRLADDLDEAILGKHTRAKGPVKDHKLPDKPLEYQKRNKQ